MRHRTRVSRAASAVSKAISLAPVVVLAIALSGCATSGKQAGDPFEGFNRKMFAFNDKIDQVALKPAATAYRAVLPSFAQLAVGNFFSNLGDVWTGINNILQGKVGDGASDFMRFAVNSTLGLGGVIDLSSLAGMPKHREDFGQTLGKWGVNAGPYVVLPLLGSSTLRDTAALPVDFQGDLWSYYDPVDVRRVGTALRLLDARAAVLDASDLIEGAALDRYEFVRDAYIQRRQNRVYDGDPPDPDAGRTAPGTNKDPDGYVPAGPTPEPLQEQAPAAKPAAKSSVNDVQPGVQSDSVMVGNAGMSEEPAVEAVVIIERFSNTIAALPDSAW
ncbi:MAG: VacJ family lipoprotein [Pseudomonadota bacterium]